jgi:adenosine deaminase
VETQPAGDLPLELFESMPKADLHRHLEGSLRLNTMLDIARIYSVTLPRTSYLRPLVQVQSEDELSCRNFLAKFQMLRLFYRSPEIIARVTREAIEDAALDNLRYLELRFTPAALGQVQGYKPDEVIPWVCEAARQAARTAGIKVRLLVSVNRHESTALAANVAQLAVDYQSQGVVGLDLAGNEAEYPVEPFVPIFRQAKRSGLHLTVHAGEWAGAQSVRQAIELLDADRIAHGVRILEDENVVALARERQIPFEVCITSNNHSGVVNNLNAHPLPTMLSKGLDVIIGTDDPSISQITLSHEYMMAVNGLGLSLSELRKCILAAGQSAFLPEYERLALTNTLRQV